MRVLEIRNIQRDEIPLYYRMTYVALAVMEMPTSTEEIPIHFTIETDPLGRKTFSVSLDEPINYPLLPVVSEIRKKIIDIEKRGIPL